MTANIPITLVNVLVVAFLVVVAVSVALGAYAAYTVRKLSDDNQS